MQPKRNVDRGPRQSRAQAAAAASRAHHTPAVVDPMNQVPFFGTLPDGMERDFWAVPAPPRSGYTGGCAAGGICAQAYLKLLRAQHQRGERWGGGILQKIALRMAERHAKVTSETEAMVIDGHFVGFFGLLDNLLRQDSPGFTRLDDVTFDELHQQLQQALEVDEVADIENNRRADRISAARKGWRTRRRKAA